MTGGSSRATSGTKARATSEAKARATSGTRARVTAGARARATAGATAAAGASGDTDLCRFGCTSVAVSARFNFALAALALAQAPSAAVLRRLELGSQVASSKPTHLTRYSTFLPDLRSSTIPSTSHSCSSTSGLIAPSATAAGPSTSEPCASGGGCGGGCCCCCCCCGCGSVCGGGCGGDGGCDSGCGCGGGGCGDCGGCGDDGWLAPLRRFDGGNSASSSKPATAVAATGPAAGDASRRRATGLPRRLSPSLLSAAAVAFRLRVWAAAVSARPTPWHFVFDFELHAAHSPHLGRRTMGAFRWLGPTAPASAASSTQGAAAAAQASEATEAAEVVPGFQRPSRLPRVRTSFGFRPGSCLAILVQHGAALRRPDDAQFATPALINASSAAVKRILNREMSRPSLSNFFPRAAATEAANASDAAADLAATALITSGNTAGAGLLEGGPTSSSQPSSPSLDASSHSATPFSCCSFSDVRFCSFQASIDGRPTVALPDASPDASPPSPPPPPPSSSSSSSPSPAPSSSSSSPTSPSSSALLASLASRPS